MARTLDHRGGVRGLQVRPGLQRQVRPGEGPGAPDGRPGRADADLAAAQALLKGWDRRTNVDSRAAPLAVLTVLRHPAVAGKPPLEVLKAVMAELKARFGRIDPTWGEVNRIRRGKVDLPIDGGPDIFRAVYGRPDPDGRLRALGGDTYVMFVTWDRDGKLSSQEHPPVRLGHPGRGLAPLRRPDAAVRDHEGEAGAVHRGPAEGPRVATTGRGSSNQAAGEKAWP